MRYVLRLWLASAIACIAIALPADSEGADAQSVGADSFNICGPENTCPGDDPANAVIYGVTFASPRPWVVSLEEVCTDLQFWRIAAALSQLGYTADFATAIDAGGTCGFYGNALYLFGQSRGTQYPERYEFQYAHQDPSPCSVTAGPECRRLLCRRVNLLAGTFVGCSTHLDAPTSSTTRAQRDEALFAVGFAYGPDVRIVGGDFNLTGVDLTNWIGGYWEVDNMFRPTHPSSNSNRKIDWAFGDSAHFPFTRLTPAPACLPSYSDHCYLRGYWVFP